MVSPSSEVHYSVDVTDKSVNPLNNNNNKIRQKIYSTTRSVFGRNKKMKEMLLQDIENSKIKRIIIKESMNFSANNNNDTNKKEITIWYNFSENLVKEGNVFYFIIKSSDKVKENIVFRFDYNDMKENLLTDTSIDINGNYNIYLAKRKDDSCFVNDRDKSNKKYIDEKNVNAIDIPEEKEWKG